MQVAGLAGDEMLVEEAALTAYNLLLPFTARAAPPPQLLLQPLAALHAGLSGLTQLQVPKLQGQATQRAAAAQGLAAATCALLALLKDKPGQSRAAGAGYSSGALETQVAALDPEVLHVLAPPTPPPRPGGDCAGNNNAAVCQGGTAGQAPGAATAAGPAGQGGAKAATVSPKGKRAPSATAKDSATKAAPAPAAPPAPVVGACASKPSNSVHSDDDTAAEVDILDAAARAKGAAELNAVQEAVLALPMAKGLMAGPVADRCVWVFCAKGRWCCTTGAVPSSRPERALHYES
jgi:hypothetical protein